MQSRFWCLNVRLKVLTVESFTLLMIMSLLNKIALSVVISLFMSYKNMCSHDCQTFNSSLIYEFHYLVTIMPLASVYSDSLLKTLSNTLTMVQIIGKYEHESSEGLEAYLKTVGGVENQEASKAFSQGKPTLEISQSGDHWIITVSNEGKSSTTKFTLGTPYDETMPHGLTLKSVTTRDGNKFITVSDLPDGNKSIRVYEFTDTGITVHLSENKHGVKAVRTYKRI